MATKTKMEIMQFGGFAALFVVLKLVTYRYFPLTENTEHPKQHEEEVMKYGNSLIVLWKSQFIWE